MIFTGNIRKDVYYTSLPESFELKHISCKIINLGGARQQRAYCHAVAVGFLGEGEKSAFKTFKTGLKHKHRKQLMRERGVGKLGLMHEMRLWSDRGCYQGVRPRD